MGSCSFGSGASLGGTLGRAVRPQDGVDVDSIDSSDAGSETIVMERVSSCCSDMDGKSDAAPSSPTKPPWFLSSVAAAAVAVSFRVEGAVPPPSSPNLLLRGPVKRL